MESLTSCEVCLEEYNTRFRRPMVVCLNGHTFCSDCSQQLTICAQCRQSCLPEKIVNIALLRIVEQKIQASSHDSAVPRSREAEESEVYPSHRPSNPVGSQDFDERDDLDSVLREQSLDQWREEESETSDEEEHLEELLGATGLFPGPRPTGFLQGATGLLFQEHLMAMESQHQVEDEDESEILMEALATSKSIAEQEEMDQEALMCALALSVDEQ